MLMYITYKREREHVCISSIMFDSFYCNPFDVDDQSPIYPRKLYHPEYLKDVGKCKKKLVK